jgi:carboxypeptidase family protein
MRASGILVALATAGVLLAQDDFSIKDFTKSPTEHIINRIYEPFVVRSVYGIITSPGVREPFPGVLFEIQGPGVDKTVRKSITDKNGQFRIRHLPAGTYHFKATRDGFQSVVGTITVSKKADKNGTVKIEMRLGV